MIYSRRTDPLKIETLYAKCLDERNSSSLQMKQTIWFIQMPKSMIVNLKSILIYIKYILTENFINRRYSKYIKMYI